MKTLHVCQHEVATVEHPTTALLEVLIQAGAPVKWGSGAKPVLRDANTSDVQFTGEIFCHTAARGDSQYSWNEKP